MSGDKINPNGNTKGTKFDGGKERFELVPMLPFLELSKLFTKGAEKYGDRNWEGGIKYGRLFNAALRHLLKWWLGQEHDQQDGQHHLIAAIWNMWVLREMQRIHPELDDREGYNLPLKDEDVDAAIEAICGTVGEERSTKVVSPIEEEDGHIEVVIPKPKNSDERAEKMIKEIIKKKIKEDTLSDDERAVLEKLLPSTRENKKES